MKNQSFFSNKLCFKWIIGIFGIAVLSLPALCEENKKEESSLKSEKVQNQSESKKSVETHQHTNRLIHEKSPYLLQHAHNPVDWYPWGEEAFERARVEDKPIFLSIGYSTCHWCHVMERESFEDEEVASLMNQYFVCIKLDREERPDIDNIYMAVCQALTQHGGWPLTIMMTPDKKPFFAGTYFPKHGRHNRPGMMELIPWMADNWLKSRGKILEDADKITEFLQNQKRPPSGASLGENELAVAYTQLKGRFDAVHGGFGSSPKFPTPHNFLFLLRRANRSEPTALNIVETTLQEMRKGGIYDHVGFGYHRYSTDREWLVPHFEKMLYDQAMIAHAYLETYQVTGKEEYAKTAREIFTYILRDMTSPEGGFYCAEDADSEGEEGKFYVWTSKELINLLGKKDAKKVAKIFGVKFGGNWIEESSGSHLPTNIFHLPDSWTLSAKEQGVSEKELSDWWEPIRQKLFDVREKRIHPYKDDKIMTDWNGLMIGAMAKGTRVLGDTQYSEAAAKSVQFVKDRLMTPEGRLLHRYREGEAGIVATLEDYAFFTWGLLELYETTFDISYLKLALDLQTATVEHFWDEDAGGFYLSADDAEELIIRPKEIYDGAIPSGNSVAFLNLLKLGRMTGNTDWEKKADELGKSFAADVTRSPSAHTFLMSALEFAVGPSYEVVVVGDLKAEDTRAMIKALHQNYSPNQVLLHRPLGEEPEITKLAEFTLFQTAVNSKATAYVCQNYSCKQPTNEIKEMLESLGVKK